MQIIIIYTRFIPKVSSHYIIEIESSCIQKNIYMGGTQGISQHNRRPFGCTFQGALGASVCYPCCVLPQNIPIKIFRSKYPCE